MNASLFFMAGRIAGKEMLLEEMQTLVSRVKLNNRKNDCTQLAMVCTLFTICVVYEDVSDKEFFEIIRKNEEASKILQRLSSNVN